MVAGPESKYHAAKSSKGQQPPAGRMMGDGPTLPHGLFIAAIAGLALMLIGMLVGTIDTINDLSDDEFDDWGGFWAGQFQHYGQFAFGVALILGAALGTKMSTGLRVGLLVMGVLTVLRTGILGALAAFDSFFPFGF